MIAYYVLVTINLTDNCIEMFSAYCKCFNRNFCSTFYEKLKYSNAVRLTESRKLFQRILIIILTVMACRIPKCVRSFVNLQFSSKNTLKLIQRSISFHAVIMILVPLNSMLNSYIIRFIYGKFCSSILKSKFQPYFTMSHAF